MDTDLDNILREEEPETITPDTGGQPADLQQQEGPRRDEIGRFASANTGENQPGEGVAAAVPAPGAPPAPNDQDTESGHVPIAALRGERQKRQQLEDQLGQALGYIQQLQNPPQQHRQPQAQTMPQTAPDIFSDPEGYTAWIRESLMADVMQEVQQYGATFGTTTRADVSEMLARQKFDDFDPMMEVAAKAVHANPLLRDQIAYAQDPAGAAYRVAKNYQEAERLATGEPASRDAIAAEVRAQVLAEYGLSPTSQPQAPNSLSGERSVGSRSGPIWSGPATLADILS